MKRVSFASAALLIAFAAEAAAAGSCYLPEEVEADQAIRLRTEMKVIGDLCKEPSYAAFAERNRDTFAAYEQILAEHLARDAAGDGPPTVAAYIAGLEKEAADRAAQSPSFCAEAFDLVALAGEMRPSDLRVYAAGKATTARSDYEACADPAGTPSKEAAPRHPAPVVTASSAAPLPAQPAGADDDDLLVSIANSDLARMLDPADRRRLHETTQQTLETAGPGQLVGWRNPFSRNAGTVVAARPFKNAAAQWCRRFEQAIYVSGETRRVDGTACRRADGSWAIEP